MQLGGPPPDFLAALRRRGIALGLDQLQRLGRLSERWEGDDAESLRAAIAALLATSIEEIEAVKDAFDQTWPPPAAAPSQRTPDPNPAASSTSLHAAPEPRLSPVQRALRALQRVRARLAGRGPLLFLTLLLLFLAPPPRLQLPPPLPSTVPRLRAGQEVRVPLPSLPSCPEENLPPPLVLYHYQRPAIAAGTLGLVALLLANHARARAAHRRRARRYLRDRLDALPGPHALRLTLPELSPPVSREDLEDMATLLGRLRGTGTDLDVPRTVDRTLRGGLLLAPVYRLRAMGGTVLVLHDIGAAMRPHQRRAEALLQGLSRLGVPIERWYFEGDASLIRDRPGGRVQPLQQLARVHGPTPILVVSSGAGAFDEETGEPAPWVIDLERLFPVRTLLHPVPDPRRWHPHLRRWIPAEGEQHHRGPLTARPMTRAGIQQAACELAQADEGYAPLERRRAVTPDDVQRLLELLAIPGEASVDLLELLRQRLCPDIPEEAILHVLARCGALSGDRAALRGAQRQTFLLAGRRRKGPLSLAAQQILAQAQADAQEAAARAAAVETSRAQKDKKGPRTQPPKKSLTQPEAPPRRFSGKPGAERELAARHLLLQILAASKPAEQDSAARQRWRLQVALHQLYLAEDAAATQSIETLVDLARGPLRPELRRALLPVGSDDPDRGTAPLPLLAPLPAALRGRLLALLRDLIQSDLPKSDGLSIGPERRLLALPGLAEPIAAVLTCALAFGGAFAFRLIPREVIPHVQGAYRLTRDAAAPEFFNVELTPSGLTAAKAGQLPLTVALYRDQEPEPLVRDVPVGERDTMSAADEPAPGAGSRLPKIEDDRVRCFHARARLPRGNYALSGQLFVAGERVAPPKGQLLVRFLSGRTGSDLGTVPYGLGNGFGETQAGKGGQVLTLTAGAWSLQSAGTPAYGSLTRALTVKPGALTELTLTLTDYATLELTALPRGVEPPQVLVNGIPFRGGPLRVQPGKVELALDHPFYDERQELVLEPGETRRMALTAQPRFGIVALRLTPARAELSLRGLLLLDQHDDEQGASVWRLRGEAGAYPVMASAPGYLAKQVMLDLQAGETLRQDITLESLSLPSMGTGGGAELREPTVARIESALGPSTPAPAEVMLRVPGGVFQMGTDKGEPEQGPAHEVAVATFLIDKTEVTVGAYQRCVQAGGCTPAGTESRYCNGNQPAQRDHPINCVTHAQARSFCAWAGKRLPTEAEWEYAARGADGRLYPWGDDAPGGQLCWRRYPGEGTCAVGSAALGRSPFGVLDLAGNVAEWTADPYCEYGRTCTSGPGREIVVRGGSWYSGNRRAVQAVDRRTELPTNRNSDLGFRCARSAL